jgi:hypothetical protein
MSEFFIQYNYCPRENNGRGGFIFDRQEVRTVGPVKEDEVELKAIELMSDANTIPSSVQVFEKATKSLSEIVEEIAEILNAESDGSFVELVANQILTNKVEYEGDSIFSQRFEVTEQMLR